MLMKENLSHVSPGNRLTSRGASCSLDHQRLRNDHQANLTFWDTSILGETAPAPCNRRTGLLIALATARLVASLRGVAGESAERERLAPLETNVAFLDAWREINEDSVRVSEEEGLQSAKSAGGTRRRGPPQAHMNEGAENLVIKQV